MSTPPVVSIPKYEVHKYRDTVKLTESNWSDWSFVMEHTLKERGLWKITTGSEKLTSITVDTKDAWEAKDASSINQMIQNMTPEIRSKVKVQDCKTSEAVWSALTKYYLSRDPNRVFAKKLKYENLYWDQTISISTHLDVLDQMRKELAEMGDIVTDEYHGSRMLRGLPESWNDFTDSVRANTTKPEEVRSRLIAQELVKEARSLTISGNYSTTMALLGHRFGQKSTPPTTPPATSNTTPKSNKTDKSSLVCENCKKRYHTKENCWAKGGGKEGQGPNQNKDKEKEKDKN